MGRIPKTGRGPRTKEDNFLIALATAKTLGQVSAVTEILGTKLSTPLVAKGAAVPTAEAAGAALQYGVSSAILEATSKPPSSMEPDHKFLDSLEDLFQSSVAGVVPGGVPPKKK